MANKAVTLVRLCKTASGWRRLPIVMGKNGKIRPGYALVNGEPVATPGGHYELRTYEGKRTVYRNVGDDAGDALTALQRESHLLSARESAVHAGVEVVANESKRHHLQNKKKEFIERHLAKGQKRAAETALISIDDFISATKCTYADQVTEESVLAFYKYMRKAGNQDRTIYNKHVSLFGWFKWMGLDTKRLADKPPSYTERDVEVFHPEDLKILFVSCDRYQKIVFETLLKTGMRMQEAMHLEWANVDFRTKKIRVREMLDDDGAKVQIKDRAERTIPLPDDLHVTLKEWRAERPNARLVLGTRNDTPNWKWLQTLKRAVRKSGLNCGRCSGCKSHNKECSHWKIHRFRATYTTTLLRNGVDPRTVMSYTGHEDMATVLRYLAPEEHIPGQKKVSSIVWM